MEIEGFIPVKNYCKKELTVTLCNLYVGVNRDVIRTLGDPKYVSSMINEKENSFAVVGSNVEGTTVRNGRANLLHKALKDFIERTITYYYKDKSKGKLYKVFGEPIEKDGKVVAIAFKLDTAVRTK